MSLIWCAAVSLNSASQLVQKDVDGIMGCTHLVDKGLDVGGKNSWGR